MTRTIFSLCICTVLVCAPWFAASVPAADARSKGGIEGAIGKTVKSFRFDGTFAKCLSDLTRLAGVPITGDWQALKVVGVTPDRHIAFSVEGVRLAQVLDVAMAKATPRDMHLGWYVDGAAGGVRVTTQRAALTSHRRATLSAPRSAPTSGATFTFSETPLEAVIQSFRELTRLNFHVNWRALAEVNVDRNTPVTLTVSGVSPARALDLVTDQLTDNLDKFQRVYWVVDRGVVKISTGTALNTGLKTQVFDVAELLMPAVSVKMPRRLGLNSMTGSNTNDRRSGSSRSGGRGGRGIGTAVTGVGLGVIGGPGADDSDGADAKAKAEELKENIVGMIKDSIGQDMWEPSGKGSIKIVGNRLVLSQTLLGYKLLDRSLRSRRR